MLLKLCGFLWHNLPNYLVSDHAHVSMASHHPGLVQWKQLPGRQCMPVNVSTVQRTLFQSSSGLHPRLNSQDPIHNGTVRKCPVTQSHSISLLHTSHKLQCTFSGPKDLQWADMDVHEVTRSTNETNILLHSKYSDLALSTVALSIRFSIYAYCQGN